MTGEPPAAFGGADESGEPARSSGDSGPEGTDSHSVPSARPPQTTGTDPAGRPADGAGRPPGGAITEPQAPALPLTPRQEPLGGTPHSPIDPVTAESLARSVAALLQARTAPGVETSSQSRGRFSYERFVSGAQRTFRTKAAPTRWAQIQVSFVGDRSSSMGNRWGEATRLQAVHAACYVFVRAGQLSRSPTHVTLFNDQVQRVLGEQPLSLDAPAMISASTAFVSSGGTSLSPALKQALARTVPHGTHHLVVIACDGELNTADQEGVQQLVRGAPGQVAFLPLLIGAEVSLSAWRGLFPGAQVARTPHELVHLTRTVLQGLRRGPWRARPVPGPRR
ncbi:hypothetical protein [Deinococcus multiflagellatus]|uniref:VWFA domain-containing protein n=1 Tax=Deinococcus multiflagellatus TaxID=1656887 RepID=A0ABW1ZVC3_9DEIO